MSDYHAPLKDIAFVLDHVVPLADVNSLEAFAHADRELVDGLLAEAGRFCEDLVAPSNRDADQQGSILADGQVRTPESFKRIYEQYVGAGWGALAHPPELGGGGFPLLVANAFKEMLTAANMAFSLGPLLTTGAVTMLVEHASDAQKQEYVTKLVSGEWAGTMNLTEPQAGSDVGAITSKAIPTDDGTWRITGQKIFITYGDHDLTDNIIHLVLARVPDAPPGTKGISCFIVPKYLVNDDGSLGEPNDVKVVSVEHKLGIHASPTCVMAFGDEGDGAVGHLIGEVNAGMRYMFTMMNDARLGVGLQGLAIGERAYQQAVAYAVERRQGRAVGADAGTSSTIVQHADVRRMLLTMKAYVEGMRALCYANAQAIDLAAHHPDDVAREHHQKLADLLTPLSKAWSTDRGVDVASLGIQVHGGMGYIEETGAAQYYRDARIAPIYEGTNGIQALDLVGRKLPYDGGAFVKGWIADLRTEAEALEGERLADIRAGLLDGISVLEEATDWMFAHAAEPNEIFAGATPYLQLTAQVAAGSLLARGAAAADRLLDGQGDEEFFAARIVVANFYVTQLLPIVAGLLPAVTAGAADLFELSEAQLTG
ncbi:MAG TPA: acyl-CoA dehydrogenase [Nitriliruptorales bacterium]